MEKKSPMRKPYIHGDRHTIVGLKEFAEDVIASVPAGLAVVNRKLDVLSANPAFHRLSAVSAGKVACGENLEAILPLPGLREQMQNVIASGRPAYGLEVISGGRCLRLTIIGICVAEEEERLLLVIEDVTEERQLREEARLHEQRLRDLVHGLDAIVWEAEVYGQEICFTFVSDYAKILLGYPAECWLGREFWPAFVHPDDRDAVFDFYDRVLERGTTGTGERLAIEYRACMADGGELWLHEVVQAHRADNGHKRLCGVAVDVTARKDMEARLSHLANHDVLTGLPNRNLLQDRLKQALLHAARHARASAVLFLDLDRFKLVNDSLGHATGDRLLKAVAERIKCCARQSDTVARLGGDEFVVILEDMAQPEDAAQVAQKILESFGRPFRVESGHTDGEVDEFFFTASIGISLYPDDGKDVQALLKNADVAMYRAKERGGNNYQFFTSEMDTRAHRRLGLENALHRALVHEQFVLCYQPQIEFASGRVIGVEALLRWNHPEQGLVAPAEFIPLLEETGLIVPVGEWALRTACAQAKAWRDAGLPPLRMAVNLSARQLRDEGFVGTVAGAARGRGPGPT